MRSRDSFLIAFALIFSFVSYSHAEKTISGSLSLTGTFFPFPDEPDFFLEIGSARVDYQLTVPDGWSGTISPKVKIELQKKRRLGTFPTTYTYTLEPKVTLVVDTEDNNHTLTVGGQLSYTSSTKIGGEMEAQTFSFAPGNGINSSPFSRQYEDLSEDQNSQDFDCRLDIPTGITTDDLLGMRANYRAWSGPDIPQGDINRNNIGNSDDRSQ